jgi:hypothetical protein
MKVGHKRSLADLKAATAVASSILL